MQNAVRKWREKRGYSRQTLADRVGTGVSQITKLERGERRLTEDWLRRLAEALDVTVSELLAEPVNGETTTANSNDSKLPKTHSHSQIFHQNSLFGARDLPVLGAARGGSEGVFMGNGEVFEYVGRPANLAEVPTAYAVYMVGESMEPRYFAGEILCVNPNKPVSRGDWVVVHILADREGGDDQYFVKRFVKRDANSLVLEELSPKQKQLAFPSERVVTVHRIVGTIDGA